VAPALSPLNPPPGDL